MIVCRSSDLLFFTFNNIFHKTHATFDAEKRKPLYKLILWKHSRSKEYLFIWTKIVTVLNGSEIDITIYICTINWSIVIYHGYGSEIYIFLFIQYTQPCENLFLQLAYGLSLQDVRHNLNILWMIAQMAFEATIIRLITKSPGFSVYLCIMNINIK